MLEGLGISPAVFQRSSDFYTDSQYSYSGQVYAFAKIFTTSLQYCDAEGDALELSGQEVKKLIKRI